VRNGSLCHVSCGKRDRSQVGDRSLEALQDVSRSDVEDFGSEDLTIFVDLLHMHLVSEGADLQLVEESGLGSLNLETSSDNLLVGNDFNLGLHDLGLDVQLLEEAGLLGVKTSRASTDPHIIGGDSTNLGGSFTGLVVKNLLDLREITICENDASVSLEELNDGIELVALLP